MSLSMQGHVDAVFRSSDVVVTGKTNGGWDSEGNMIPPAVVTATFTRANIQPLNNRELENLLRAGERIVDGRKIYINSGDFDVLALATNLTMLGQEWKIVQSDVRPWRNYAKIVVSRYDNQ